MRAHRCTWVCFHIFSLWASQEDNLCFWGKQKKNPHVGFVFLSVLIVPGNDNVMENLNFCLGVQYVDHLFLFAYYYFFFPLYTILDYRNWDSKVK